jgi:hypothetical protein
MVGGTPINQYEYERLLLETLDKFGVLTSVHRMLVLEQKYIARAMITCLTRIVRYNDVIAYEASVVNMMVLADNQLQCILHLRKRVMEKIMSMIYSISLDEVSTTNKNARKRQAGKIAEIINVSAFGKPGTYKVPYDPHTGKVGEVKYDNSPAKYLEDILPEMLSLVIAKQPNQSNWLDCTGHISSIILEISQQHDFTEAATDSL